MRPMHGIILHCSATRPAWMANSKTSAKVAEIRRWHVKDRGWRDIGYHFLIDRDGTVASGRPIEQTGSHTQGRNTGTIGICLLGGHGSAADDPFERNFTPQQDAAARKLITDLRAKYGRLTLAGHNNFAAKACPGFSVGKWFG